MRVPRVPGISVSRFGWSSLLTLLLLIGFGWNGAVQACEVPVFRYALERWQVTPCRITVFHRGALAAEQSRLVEALGQSNLFSVETCDLSASTNGPSAAPADLLELWSRLPQPPALPAVTLSCWGGRSFMAQATWTRPLNPETIGTLKKLPAHREVARRLLSGDSAVWVLLSCPDAAKNTAAKKMLGEVLQEQEKTLKLPHEQDPNDTTYSTPVNGSIPLKIYFSVLEVPGQSAEADLIRCAVRTITTNAITTTEPVAIPVFGRGLALDAFSGLVLDPEIVREVCSFLCGACSCSIKDMKPGISLFIPLDWDMGGVIAQPVEEAMPPLMVPGATAPR